MNQRGRKSNSAKVAMIGKSNLEPPAHLTKSQLKVWNSVIKSLPSFWFNSENEAILEKYCCHVARSRALERALIRMGSAALTDYEDVKHYDRLASMSERETRNILALATKMRLTPQSRSATRDYKPPDMGSNNGAGKPWEEEADL